MPTSNPGTGDRSLPCGAREIPARIRARFESLFGRDLSEVRIVASDWPALIGARAFAFGSTVFVSRMRGLFDTADGWRVLGHELTHVIQQRDGRATRGAEGSSLILQDCELEREADRQGEVAARAFTGELGESRRAYPAQAEGCAAGRPVIQCLMTLEEFKGATATRGIRSLDKIAAVDSALKAYEEANSRKPRNFTELHKANRRVYEAAHSFKSQKPDSSRMAVLDKLIRESVIEDAIYSRLAAIEAETDEVAKFRLFEQVQENFFKQINRKELNNKTIDGDLVTLRNQLINGASNRGEALVRRDIEELIKIGQAPSTPGLLKSVIAECTASRNAQMLDMASGKPGLKYNTARTATQKYSLSHALDQSLGKRFRMGSLLHELTHLSIAEIFNNTAVMLAVRTDATDEQILNLARERNGRLRQLVAQIDAHQAEFVRMWPFDITQNGVKNNALFVEYKEKALYPVSGKFAQQYLRVFKDKVDATTHARLTALAAKGLDCELIEYDTVINQMLLWSHLFGMNTTCGVYTTLEALVQEAYAYRMRERAMKSRPPAKPLPPVPVRPGAPPATAVAPVRGKPLPAIPVRKA